MEGIEKPAAVILEAKGDGNARSAAWQQRLEFLMALKPVFDVAKAVEAIVYVAGRLRRPDMYTVLKVLYFADRLHLERYGRQILGDRYIAMKDGPVPSGSYDLVKTARGDAQFPVAEDRVRASFTAEKGGDHLVRPLRDADEDCFSVSDQECLDEAIRDYGHLSFGKLKYASHDDAYKKAHRDGEMALEDIARSVGNDGHALVEHLRERLG